MDSSYYLISAADRLAPGASLSTGDGLEQFLADPFEFDQHTMRLYDCLGAGDVFMTPAPATLSSSASTSAPLLSSYQAQKMQHMLFQQPPSSPLLDSAFITSGIGPSTTPTALDDEPLEEFRLAVELANNSAASPSSAGDDITSGGSSASMFDAAGQNHQNLHYHHHLQRHLHDKANHHQLHQHQHHQQHQQNHLNQQQQIFADELAMTRPTALMLSHSFNDPNLQDSSSYTVDDDDDDVELVAGARGRLMLCGNPKDCAVTSAVASSKRVALDAGGRPANYAGHLIPNHHHTHNASSSLQHHHHHHQDGHHIAQHHQLKLSSLDQHQHHQLQQISVGHQHTSGGLYDSTTLLLQDDFATTTASTDASLNHTARNHIHHHSLFSTPNLADSLGDLPAAFGLPISASNCETMSSTTPMIASFGGSQMSSSSSLASSASSSSSPPATTNNSINMSRPGPQTPQTNNLNNSGNSNPLASQCNNRKRSVLMNLLINGSDAGAGYTQPSHNRSSRGKVVKDS